MAGAASQGGEVHARRGGSGARICHGQLPRRPQHVHVITIGSPHDDLCRARYVMVGQRQGGGARVRGRKGRPPTVQLNGGRNSACGRRRANGVQ